MIYLFDDKKNRQNDAGWDEQRFNKYSDIIKPIYLFSEIDYEPIKREIFSSGSIVIFHESFFDNVLNRHHKDGIEIRNKLNEFSSKNKNFQLVFFSGSKNTRNLTENVGHIPVSILYQNLEVFCNKVKGDDINIRYLLFGKNHEVEEVLLSKLNNANNQIEDSIEDTNPTSQNFIAVTQMGEIEIPFENVDCETFFTDDITDEYESDIDKYCTELITKWFLEKEYDNIFIPISFGSTLSDFNGLRFATHIRCSNSLNRLKNIFLYSFVSYEYLVENEYFDILKTKNVYLIDYKKTAFAKAVESSFDPLTLVELSKELKKIKLEPPKNYEDSHSIANEWAIYRWALTISTSDNDIEQIVKKVNNQLYFKYLNSKYPKDEIKIIPEKELKIEYSGKPKILYIDDEADKGWYEIFCKVLFDLNGLDFVYLDEEFNSKTQDEIIKISIDKIHSIDIDLIILDFRLHPNDFLNDNIQEVTGLKLLKEIKKLNPGIQVIVFSATNKVWNLHALLDAGADGFIVKESPENSIDANCTIKSIKSIISTIEKCAGRFFLKDFYKKLDFLKSELIPRKNYRKSPNPLPKEFVDEVIQWLKLSNDLLGKGISNTSLTAAFLFMFSVLENLSNRIINIENPIEIDEVPGKYKFEFRIDKRRLRRFIEDENNPGFYRRTKRVLESNRNLPWIYKILNTLDFITQEKLSEKELSLIVKKRNDIIHANSTTGEKIEINLEMIISINTIIYNGLINVK